MNFANLYSDNRPKVKEFLSFLENISASIQIVNLNFLTAEDLKKNTILHLAVLNKDLDIIQTILNLIQSLDQTTKSKFLNYQNINGDTALHIAAKMCQEKDGDCAVCEAIAKNLDVAGCRKDIANNRGQVIEASDSPKSNSSSSSANSLISKIFGGFSNSLDNITTDVSVDRYNNKKYPLLNNMNTEVSVDNAWKKKSPVLNNMNTEVSVDNAWKKNVSLNEFSSEVSVDNITDSSEVSESYTGGSSSISTSEQSNSSVTNSVTESSEQQSGGSSSYESVSQTETSSSSSSSFEGQRGGAAYSESSGLSDTSAFVKTLLTQFNSMKGGSRHLRGERKLPSLSDYDMNEIYGGRDFGLSREQMKESSNIHDQVVKMFIDNGKSEEEARIIKMALYKYTKDKHPDLNNLDRAKKMKDYAEDNSILKKLDIDSTRKIYDEVKKSKSMISESSSQTPITSEDSESTEEKPKKKTSKKAAEKEPKKASKKTTAKKTAKK
jgi:hypothetical protein